MKIFYKSNRFGDLLKPLATLILLFTFFINVNAQNLTSNSPVNCGNPINLTFDVGGCTGITSVVFTGPGFSFTDNTPPYTATRLQALKTFEGTYTATVIGGSCAGTYTTNLVVNGSLPVKPIIYTGLSEVCVGQSSDYKAVSVVGESYAWTSSSSYGTNSNMNTDASNTSVSVNWYASSPVNAAWVSVSATNSCGAVNSDNKQVTVRALPLNFSIAPNPITTYCHNGEGVTINTLALQETGIRYYLMSSPNNTIIEYKDGISGNALTFSNVKVTNNNSPSEETTDFYITAQNIYSGCQKNSTNYVTVTKLGEITAPVANNVTKNYDGISATGSVNTVPPGYTLIWYANSTGTALAAAPSITNVGSQTTYAVFKSNTSPTFCESARTPVTVTVNPTALTITADNKTKTYDGLVYNGGYSVSYSGFVNGETVAVLGGTLAYTGTAIAATNFGTYVITPGGLTSNNYAITFVNGSLDITKKALTITADNKSKVYNGLVYSGYTITPTGFENGETVAVLGGTLAYTGTAIAATNFGTYVITPGGLTSNNYAITFVNGSLDITKKALTITADNKSKVYNGLVYSGYTITPTGFENGETVAVLGGTLAYTGTAIAATNFGTYVITPGGLTSNNYAITFVNGSLDITKKALTITADNKSKVYNGLVYSGYTITPTGLENGETVAVLGGTLAYTGTAIAATNFGTYVITPGGLTSNNYAITFVNGSLDITKKALTITADNKSKVYNGLVYSGYTITPTGLENGETVAVLGGTLAYTGTAIAATNFGTYVITPGGLTSNNYAITFVNGSLDITKKALTITADYKSKVYDGMIYTGFTATPVGLENGETVSVLGGTLVFTGTAITAINLGSYVITPGGLTSSNYAITFVDGTLDITKQPLTITAVNKTKVYNGQIYSAGYTVTYSGFTGGDTEASLGGILAFTGTAIAATNFGTYVITPGGLTSSNYSITFVSGTLDITKKALTITADNKSKVYNGLVYSGYTITPTGLENGETVAVLGGTLAYTGTAIAATNFGTYVITPGGLTSNNYAITFVNGSLDITKKALTITADNKSKVYNGLVYSGYTITPTGLENGETVAVLGGTLAYTGTAIAATNFGTYVITPGGLTSNNYAITFVNGSLDITKKAITITADDKSKVYNGLVYSGYTITTTGLENGETVAVLGGTLAYTGTAIAATNFGTYVITPGGLTSNNYAITFVNGSLDITKKAITITADDKSKVYNGLVYSGYTITTTGLENGETVAVLGGTLAYTGTAIAATNFGTYVITPGGLTSNNYTIQYVNGNLSITPLTINVTANSGQTKVYGDVDPLPFTYTFTPALIGGDVFTGTLARTAGENVGNAYAINQGTLALSTNYTLVYNSANFSITKKMLTPNVTANNKCFDGSNIATLSSQTLTGVLGADVVILNVASASFATSTPGMQTVIASGLTLSGASAGNYMLSSLTAATNAEIYELPAPVIAGASSSCPNVTTPYFDTDISGGTYTYQWTVSGGIIQYGANTDQIQVIWNNNYTSGWLKLTKTNTLTGCIYTTAEYPVIINTLPAPVITGLNAVSENQAGVTYTTPSVTNHLYSWFVVGGNIVAGQGTNSITVNWSNAGTGSVAVTQTSASSCETTYSMNVSIQALGYTISGYVNYDNTYNTALNGVTVNLKNAQGIVIGTAVTAPNFGSTGQSGYYSIANIPAGNYTLGAQYNGTLGGNNATDALAIQLNILGSYPLTGVKAIAADVNMSGGISSLDALYIKLRTIGTINTYPAGNWKFEEFSITVSTADIAQNIKGLCVGDVNGSYIPNMLKSTSDINSISDNTIKIQNGKSFNYDIKSASLSNLGAVTLIMNYNDNLFEIENVTSSLKDVKYVVNNGQVSIAWSDVMGNSFKNEDAIISLQMKAKQSIEKAIEIFTISNESEFADITANRIGNVNLKLSKVITENENGFSVNNYPNPFNQTTNINYTIAEKSSVKITLTNLIGQTIATITQEVKDAGSYNVVVNADALNLEAGIYLYNVEVKGLTSSFIRTNKLVLEK